MAAVSYYLTLDHFKNRPVAGAFRRLGVEVYNESSPIRPNQYQWTYLNWKFGLNSEFTLYIENWVCIVVGFYIVKKVGQLNNDDQLTITVVIQYYLFFVSEWLLRILKQQW